MSIVCFRLGYLFQPRNSRVRGMFIFGGKNVKNVEISIVLSGIVGLAVV